MESLQKFFTGDRRVFARRPADSLNHSLRQKKWGKRKNRKKGRNLKPRPSSALRMLRPMRGRQPANSRRSASRPCTSVSPALLVLALAKPNLRCSLLRLTARAANDLTPRRVAPRAAVVAQAREKHAQRYIRISAIRQQTNRHMDRRVTSRATQHGSFSLPGITLERHNPGSPKTRHRSSCRKISPQVYSIRRQCQRVRLIMGLRRPQPACPRMATQIQVPGWSPVWVLPGGTTLWARESCGWFLNSNR